MATKTSELIAAIQDLLLELKNEHDRLVESQKTLARRLEKAKEDQAKKEKGKNA